MLTIFKKKQQNTVSLLSYWSTLHILVLTFILVVIALIGSMWIQYNAYEQGYQLMELRAVHLSNAFAKALPPPPPPPRIFKSVPMIVKIVDSEGKIEDLGIESRSEEEDISILEKTPSLYKNVLAGNVTREKLKTMEQTWLRVGVPIEENGKITKALYISMPTKGVKHQIWILNLTLLLIVGIIGLAGWILIYFISRRLTRPLREISLAAKTVATGEYNLVLPKQVKEKELYQLIESFEDMTCQLKNLEELRTKLLAGVSHELRTPITSIRGMLQAIKSEIVTGKDAEDFLTISFNETIRLQQMVEELLDLSTLEGTMTHLEKNEVNLSRIIREVVNQVNYIDDFQDIDFKLDLFKEDVLVIGDADRLRQILLNLLKNSQKAGATVIEIIIKKDNTAISVDIADNGKGISINDQPYIFERFYRGNSKVKKEYGLGLGLTISKLIAKAHGGDIILFQTSPEKTIFRFILP